MTPRQADRAADIFTALVIASVAVALAGLTWRIAAGLSHRPPPPMLIETVPRNAVDVSPILALVPFGNGASGAPTPTTQPIELRGVILTVPASASMALIAPTGGTPLAYGPGGALPGGGTIETIGLDNVVLAIAGRREILSFPKPGAPPAPLPLVGASATPLIGSTAAPGQAGGAPLAASPQALLDSFGASPVNGGYRVGESLSPTVRQAGLQPGDIIQQVNGTMLGNPAMDQQLLAAAVRSGSVRIDVMRGDRHMTLAFPLR